MYNLNIAASVYVPTAIYYDEADILEYVTKDVACISRRVDSFLTLVISVDDRKTIGFILKGFKYFFNHSLKSKVEFENADFVKLVSIIEAAISEIGNDIFSQQRNLHDAYAEAIDLADDVHFPLKQIIS